jgi:FAD/FMN-containing dehydrogenase
MTSATNPNVLPASAIAELQGVFTGEITGPEDPGYEDARKVWNGSIDKRPALIVRPTGVADVIPAVRFARERDSLVAIRGGAHSVAGHSTCDDGLIIDLSGPPCASLGYFEAIRTSSTCPVVRAARIAAA